MSNRELSPTAKILIDAKTLIEDKSHWWGLDQTSYGEKRVFCAMQAIAEAGKKTPNRRYADAQYALIKASYELFNKGPVDVNDNFGHEAVMKIYDLAIHKELNKVPA